jgi:hypothetical protein
VTGKLKAEELPCPGDQTERDNGNDNFADALFRCAFVIL